MADSVMSVIGSITILQCGFDGSLVLECWGRLPRNGLADQAPSPSDRLRISFVQGSHSLGLGFCWLPMLDPLHKTEKGSPVEFAMDRASRLGVAWTEIDHCSSC